jgi:hypothetical protein
LGLERYYFTENGEHVCGPFEPSFSLQLNEMTELS